jgi:hypothetical protein
MAIMKRFGRLPVLFETLRADPRCLENVVMESGRKINKTCAENIQKYLM